MGLMRKARYLAPWHREGVDFSGCGDDEGRVAEALAGLRGKPAIYHCVSRIVNRDFVLGREEKEKFVALMRVYARFCQVRVLTFCVMSNHVHILVEVPAAPEDRGASWTDEELLGHLECLYSEREMGELRGELEHYRGHGMAAAAEGFREKYFARMWDLSAYMKVLKQCFTQWFNRKHGRVGVLWEGRFKSVLVEDGHAARTVAAYVDLNPVRAGLVSDPKDYRWSGYGEAVAGKELAREGVRLVVFEKLLCLKAEELAAEEVVSWRELGHRYRLMLFQEGGRSGGDAKPGCCGISREEVERVLAAGGELSEGEMKFCKARHLVDGLVIGTEGFVNEVYGLTRGYFGKARTSGARKLRRVCTSLRTMRDLQRDPVSL